MEMEDSAVELGDEPFVFRLNDNGTGPGLLIKVCTERGWRLFQGSATGGGAGAGGGEDRWNLWWRTGAFPPSHHKTLSNWQFMNHIPKGGSICRKDNLSRLMRCMRKIYGSIYDYSPPGFHLPLEYAKLVTECSRLRRRQDGEAERAVWIHKPVAQSQGRGIFLFRSVCEVRCGSAAVVQRYIERPLLIAGYKFDLRLYVCVPSYRPLTAYMYAEGLARFGTDQYTLSDLHNPYRHLTNSSLNKTGPRYAECKDRIGNGCKWTLKQLRRQLSGRLGRRGASEAASEWLVWQRVRALVALTLLAQAAGTPPTRNCFEFYGFDVLLDDNLKPWLLEVNLSPALAADCEADVAVKSPMLHELFDLLGLPVRHTGLALFAAPAAVFTSSSSDDETPGGGSAPASTELVTRQVVAFGDARRGLRHRNRRRPLSMHRVTINPPEQLKEVTEQATDLRNIQGRPLKTSPQHRPDDVTGFPTALQFASETEFGLLDDRMLKVTPGSKKKRWTAPTAVTWGNGVQWDRAPGRVGLWVRIYPHEQPDSELVGGDDIRGGVGQVSRFLRASREVVRDTARHLAAKPRDLHNCTEEYLEAALRAKLCANQYLQIWIPPVT